MITYKKRIAFIISSQHLIPHGGIGQFCKGFCEMAAELDWIVDIIMDKPPVEGEFKSYIESVAGDIIFPKDVVSNRGHNQVYSFADSFSIERMLNFRNSMMEAFQRNLYDLLIINTPEAIVPIYGFDIQDFIPVVFYTHNENMVFKDTNNFKGVFNGTFDEFFIKLIGCEGIFVGTQSERNVEELSKSQKNTVLLPMPLPERSLLEPYFGDTEGVLFIGRWEERKNPKEFLRVIEETRLPARVMTNGNGAKQFEKELKKIGVKFEIRSQIIGDEKVDFIKKSRVFYMPSKSECYPFAFFETVGHVPSVVLSDYSWHSNFDSTKFSIVSKTNAASKILELYQNRPDVDINYVISLHEKTKQRWVEFLNKFQSKKSDSSAALVNKWDNFYLNNFYKSLDRFASIDDIKSVLANMSKFKLTYTKNGTWMSKTNTSPIEINQEKGALFFE